MHQLNRRYQESPYFVLLTLHTRKLKMQKYTASEMLSPKNSKLLDDVVLLLTHSFTDDIMHRWLLDERNREAYIAALPIWLRFLVRVALYSDASVIVVARSSNTSHSGKAKETKEDGHKSKNQLQIQLPPDFSIQALAITIPPHGNAKFDSTWTTIRAGSLKIPFQLGLSFTRRFLLKYLPQISKMHDDCYPDPSTRHANYHLLFLAAHPDSQGQGLGKKMLQELQNTVTTANTRELQTAKAKGMKPVPCTLYLEASSVDSKRLYTRVGFELRATFAYGQLDEGEDLRLAEDGSVLGGRQYGMVWTPKEDDGVETVQQ